jgi:hypothetical protein
MKQLAPTLVILLSGCSFMAPKRGECIRLTDGFYEGCIGRAVRKASFSDAAIVGSPLLCDGTIVNSYLIVKTPFGWERELDCSALDGK